MNKNRKNISFVDHDTGKLVVYRCMEPEVHHRPINKRTLLVQGVGNKRRLRTVQKQQSKKRPKFKK